MPKKDKVSSAYIHLPFCEKICSYCDFCKIYYNQELVFEYLQELEKEITSLYQGDELKTIYIGGGTPSSLSIEELEYLFQILSKLNKSANLEYTIEGNFESTTKEKLLLYKKYGINRLSFGLESTNESHLKFLEREFNKEKVVKTIKLAKELGFNNINIDLMYALPSETIEDLKKDLAYILELDIEHISTYSLIIEPHTKLSIMKVKNIDEDLDYEMYKFICKILHQNNYNHYEISNFSKSGFESKHNLCYWNNQKYYGFGLGASSYLNNERLANTRSITKYLKGSYLSEVEKLTEKEKMEYEIILNLRKKTGIDLQKFKDKYQKDLNKFYNYQSLLTEGLLKENSKYLFIPENKWYISNGIIIKMLEGEING